MWINVCSGFGFFLRGARILMLASVSREGRLGSFNDLEGRRGVGVTWVECRWRHRGRPIFVAVL